MPEERNEICIPECGDGGDVCPAAQPQILSPWVELEAHRDIGPVDDVPYGGEIFIAWRRPTWPRSVPPALHAPS